jgi:hypothetical protein
MVARKQVVVWEDRFGKRHDTHAEALRAEAYNDLEEALENASAYGEMQVEDIPKFLDDNQELVRNYLALGIAVKQ